MPGLIYGSQLITNLALVPLGNASFNALVLIALKRVKPNQTWTFFFRNDLRESLFYFVPLTQDTTLERTLQRLEAKTTKHKRRRTEGPLNEQKVKHRMYRQFLIARLYVKKNKQWRSAARLFLFLCIRDKDSLAWLWLNLTAKQKQALTNKKEKTSCFGWA